MQDDDGSPRRVEPPEGIVDELTIDDVRCGICDRRPVDRVQLDLDWSSSPVAQRVDTGTNEEPMEPTVETIRIAQSGQVSPCPDERFLDCVAGELPIPKDQPCGCVQSSDTRVNELGKGVMIASPGPLHECSLIHGCLTSQRADLARSDGMSGGGGESFPVGRN